MTTLPREVIAEVIVEYLDRNEGKDKVPILASPKAGLPLRAWLPVEVIERMRRFCSGRCSRTAFFYTAAVEYFLRRGLDIRD
jgi:hypothetical protein